MTSTTRLCYTITETGNKYTPVSFCGILFSSARKQAKGEGQGRLFIMGQSPISHILRYRGMQEENSCDGLKYFKIYTCLF